MKKLRLCHISAPARINGLEDYSDFGHHGLLNLTIRHNNIQHEYQIGYTKPFQNKANNIFANVINLNQFGNTAAKSIFNEWQIGVTNNKSIEIDIYDFQFEILTKEF